MLAELLYNHFKMINSRLNTFSGIIKSLILCRGSHCKNLAEEIKGDILLESKIKSVRRFLAGNHINDDDYHSFMKQFVPFGKLLLTLDRTTWELGKNIRNILVLAVSYDKIGMPLLFTEIPYKGACTAEDQVSIIERFIKIYGKERIEAILGDREFDNEKLVSYLDKENINYAFRVRKTNRITDEYGAKVKIETLGNKQRRNLKTKFYSVLVKFDHIKLESGEYLSVVSSLKSSDGLELYRRRWDIESGFKGCKTSGFRMEDTHLTNSNRLVNFIKCIFIAFAIAIKIGAMENQKKPIEVKKTLGCKAYSMLQYGIKTIKQAYSNAIRIFDNLIIELVILCYFQPT